MAEENNKNPAKPTSRRYFLKTALAALVIAPAAAVAQSYLIEPFNLEVTHLTIPIKGLHPDFDGFKIVHISDTHHSEHVNKEYLRRVVQTANSHKPDMALLTGDYVDLEEKFIENGIEILAGLKATHGTASVLGNHDHWVNAEKIQSELEKRGIPVLTNRNMAVSSGRAKLYIAGVGDLWEDRQSLETALDGIPPDASRILMSHNPDFAEMIPADKRIDLLLAGHTHGGQLILPVIGPPVIPSFYGEKYLRGFVQGPSCPVYVSRGIGTVGIPLRFRCRPEMPVITLKKV